MKNIPTRFWHTLAIGVLCFTCTCASIAQASTSDLFKKCSSAKIPAKIGRISAINQAGTDRLFIVLEANYCCPENENNLLTVLEILMNLDAKKQIGMISVEGACGVLDNPATAIITDANRKTQINRNLLDAGLLTAAEFIKAQTRPDIEVFGGEKTENYLANLLFWLQLHSPIKNRQQTADALLEATSTLAARIFPEEMLEITGLGTLPQDPMKMYKYCTDFARVCRKNDMPPAPDSELTKFTQIFTKEVRLSKDKVRAQTQKLIDRIKLSPQKDASMPVASLEQYYELGMISDLEYYTIIKNFAAQANVDTSAFDAFEQKLELLGLIASADLEKLKDELEEKKHSMQEKLLTTSNQRLLYTLDKLAEKINKTINLNIKPGQSAFLPSDQSFLNAKAFVNFFTLQKDDLDPRLFEKVTDKKQVQDLIEATKQCVQFIRGFDKTYPHILDNTIERMKAVNTNAAIIIAGEQNTAKLAGELKKQRLSFVHISPATTRGHSAQNRSRNKFVLPGNSFMAPFNPHTPPPSAWADSFLQFPQQDIPRSIKNTARFKSTASVRLQSLLYAQSARSFSLEFGPAFLALCAQTEKFSKTLSAISSDISAGRVDTVENSNSLVREITMQAKQLAQKQPAFKNYWLNLSFNPSKLPEKLETGCTKTASKGDAQYIFINTYLDSTDHELALNINAKSIDPVYTIWQPVEIFAQTEINKGLRTVQTPVALPIKAEDMPDFVNTAKIESLKDKLNRTGILDSVKKDFEQGIKARGELVIIADLSDQANEVFTNLIGKVLDWQNSKNVTMPELIYEIELDILNNYSTDTLTDENVERILFNLSAVVEHASIFLENQKKLNPAAPPALSIKPESMLTNKTLTQTQQAPAQNIQPQNRQQQPAREHNLTQATLEFESELIFTPKDQPDNDPWQFAVESLGPAPLIQSGTQVRSSLGQVADTLKKIGVIDEEKLDQKSQMVSDNAKTIYDTVSTALKKSHTQQIKQPQKITEEQIDNILAIASRANPVAFIQAQTAGHIKIIRKTLSEVEVNAQESILEAIRNNQSIGSKILLAILGKKATSLDEEVN